MIITNRITKPLTKSTEPEESSAIKRTCPIIMPLVVAGESMSFLRYVPIGPENSVLAWVADLNG